MGNYTKTFGTGVIPTFNITPGQGNTSWKYGGDESAAILDEYLAERALAKAEQEDTFTNKTIPSIKKLLFVLKVIKLPIPENDNERTIIDIKKTNNSRINIK